MNMRTALVTGASRGIGRAIALELAQCGFRVYGSATLLENMNNSLAIASSKKLSIIPIAFDVTDLAQCEQTITKIEQDTKEAISVLINNAGITRDNLLLRMKDDEWNDVINANLNSVYRLSKLALRSMIKSRFGRIVNITSVVGSSGNPGQTNYCASKAGIAGFTRSLALEVANRNITVNCLAPGLIETDMTEKLSQEQKEDIIKKIPSRRLGSTEDIAKAVSFLVSDNASYITGETIHINGGMYLSV